MALTGKSMVLGNYYAGPDLWNAFETARLLGKPLLLEGEPGTGKTELARAFADYTGSKLYVFPVTSKSTIEYLVSAYDPVQRLSDAQMTVLNAQMGSVGLEERIDTGGRKVDNPSDYVRLGPLALAYQDPTHSVLSLDEMDKAPRDFPNNLLYTLDKHVIIIPETGQIIEAETMPVIVVTSNREQPLSDAFLGRCIYQWIPFPDPQTMETIVRLHHPKANKDLVIAAIDIVYQLRQLGLERNPATRELIEWIGYLHHMDGKIRPKDLDQLPGYQVLIKTREDVERVLPEIREYGMNRRAGSHHGRR